MWIDLKEAILLVRGALIFVGISILVYLRRPTINRVFTPFRRGILCYLRISYPETELIIFMRLPTQKYRQEGWKTYWLLYSFGDRLAWRLSLKKKDTNSGRGCLRFTRSLGNGTRQSLLQARSKIVTETGLSTLGKENEKLFIQIQEWELLSESKVVFNFVRAIFTVTLIFILTSGSWSEKTCNYWLSV